MTRSRASALLVVLLLAHAYSGFAQTAPGDRQREARELHRKGITEYDLGRYDEAIAAFQAAYELSPAPGLLFNIAQAYRAQGPSSCPEALRFYKTYLRLEPDTENRSAVEARITELEPCAAQQERERVAKQRTPARKPAPAPTAKDSSPARDSAPDRSLPLGPIIVAGAGVGLAGTGAILYASAGSEYNRLKTACAGRDCAPDSWESYQSRERVGVGMMAAGGALLAAAAVWWIALPSASARQTVWIGVSPVGVVGGGAF